MQIESSNSNGSVVRSSLIMVVIPLLVAVVTILINGSMLSHIDGRYTTLLSGIPWTLSALAIAYWCWIKGHRIVAVAGSIFWSVGALLSAWIVIGFWNG